MNTDIIENSEEFIRVSTPQNRDFYLNAAKVLGDINRDRLLEILATMHQRAGHDLYYSYEALGLRVEDLAGTLDPWEHGKRLSAIGDQDILRLTWLSSIHPDDIQEIAVLRGVHIGQSPGDLALRSPHGITADELGLDSPDDGSPEAWSLRAERAALEIEMRRAEAFAALADAVPIVEKREIREIIHQLESSGPQAAVYEAIGLGDAIADPDMLLRQSKETLLRLAWLSALDEENVIARASNIGVDLRRIPMDGEITIHADVTPAADNQSRLQLEELPPSVEAHISRGRSQAEPIEMTEKPEAQRGLGSVPLFINEALQDAANGSAALQSAVDKGIIEISGALHQRTDLNPTERRDLAEFFTTPEAAQFILFGHDPNLRIAMAQATIAVQRGELVFPDAGPNLDKQYMAPDPNPETTNHPPSPAAALEL